MDRLNTLNKAGIWTGLMALLLLSGCVTYGPTPGNPLSLAVLPATCDPEQPSYSEAACGEWFYKLGVAQANYDATYVNYENLGSDGFLPSFHAGYRKGNQGSVFSGYSVAGSYGAATTNANSSSTSTEPNSMLNIPQQHGGIPRYGSDQATGPVINGVHHGIPAGPPQKTCYGAILNGSCTGPEF